MLRGDLTEKDMKKLSNREFESPQFSVQQLKERFEQGRESANGMGTMQTNPIHSRSAPDRERVVRSLKHQRSQEKKVPVAEIQESLGKEIRNQLRQNELQNKGISRQNRDRELEDKEAQLEEQRRQLEEERLRRTGLEEELHQLRLEFSAERAWLATELDDKQAQLEEQRRQLEEERLRGTGLEEELRQLQLKLDNERRIRVAAELEVQSYFRETELMVSDYEQRLQETLLKTHDWILGRDEIATSSKTLGGGAWGKVVRGQFRGSKVAVKQIHELILSPHNRRLFEREMSIASQCRHPCLLQFIGATNDDGTPLFVTELLDTDLRSVLSQRSLLHEEIITIACDIAKALNYLHLNRPSPIIHRDISSSNVLLWKREYCWRAKLSDYGAANFMQQLMTTMPGASIYAAPEAMTNQQSPKIDVYSFGLLLCEMCTRELPVPEQRQEQIRLVTNQVLRELVMRCVQTNPKSRPSMEVVITYLDD